MDKVSVKVVVLFEEPFWVGVFECTDGQHFSVSKVTFGAEPKDYEVCDFILRSYSALRFSPTLNVETSQQTRINPKRRQREVKKQMETIGIGTKSQQALKLQQEQGKLERKRRSREKKEAEQQIQFQRKQEKRKQKHKGR